MQRKKVLVCGATGFIGRNIAERLAELDEYDVTGTYFSRVPYENRRIAFVHADLTERATVQNLVAGMDIVLHYAGRVTNLSDKLQTHAFSNLIMSAHLIESAVYHKVSHFVFPSCGYLYNSGELPFTEEEVDLNLLPREYFAMTWAKIYCERLCEEFAVQSKTKFSVLRQANIYGVHDKTDGAVAHAVPAIIIKAVAAHDGQLEVWGDGKQRKDILYVSDLVSMIVALLQKKERPFDFLNVGSGEFVSMQAVAEAVVQMSGKKLQISHNNSMPSSGVQWRLNCDRARTEFGWQPHVGVANGLQLTYEWYRSVLQP